jgi:sterol desaturase/sphingolipid hydroxylase (fatty acid hydroxylase superfamily)
MDLVLSAKIILGTFSASTATTMFICWFNNFPFMKTAQNRYQFYSNVYRVIESTSTVLVQAIIINSFLVSRLIEDKPHTLILSASNILQYSVITELVYYIYHRIIHTKSYYKRIHSMHHESIVVYPFDTFYMTRVDSFFLILALGTPYFFIRMNFVENCVSLYIYTTAAYLEHSTIYFTHHAKHHKLMFCNYCILNPIFDLLVGTYKY